MANGKILVIYKNIAVEEYDESGKISCLTIERHNLNKYSWVDVIKTFNQ